MELKRRKDGLAGNEGMVADVMIQGLRTSFFMSNPLIVRIFEWPGLTLTLNGSETAMFISYYGTYPFLPALINE